MKGYVPISILLKDDDMLNSFQAIAVCKEWNIFLKPLAAIACTRQFIEFFDLHDKPDMVILLKKYIKIDLLLAIIKCGKECSESVFIKIPDNSADQLKILTFLANYKIKGKMSNVRFQKLMQIIIAMEFMVKIISNENITSIQTNKKLLFVSHVKVVDIIIQLNQKPAFFNKYITANALLLLSTYKNIIEKQLLQIM